MLTTNKLKCLSKHINSQLFNISTPNWTTICRQNNGYKTSERSFHRTSLINGKIFRDTENTFAHGILQKYNYNICKDICQPTGVQDVKIEEILMVNYTTNITEMFNNYKAIVNFCNLTETSISDERFDNFIDHFTDHCNKLSDEQLIESISLLRLLPATQGVNVRNYVELWSTLDYACIDRMDKWTIDIGLLVCDYWYMLNLGKCSEFVWEFLRKVGRKIVKLSSNHLVQTMFYCNLVRQPLIEMFDFEVRFTSIIDTLSIEEISVMCIGFFKTQTPIRNPVLMSKIYNRFFEALDSIEDLTLVNIVKLLRYSSKLPQADLLMEMMERLRGQIDRLSLLSCLHIALAGCDLQMSNDKTITKIIERFNRDIDSARLKDMERISHVMGLFNIETESGVEKELSSKILVKIKDRIEEIVTYPRCFPQCLHYLTLGGFYDEELIDVALSRKFVKHAYANSQILSREMFCLDSYTRIDLKDTYNGSRLTDDQRKKMGKVLTHYIPIRNGRYKLNVTDKIILDVKDSVDSLHNFSTLRHLLPHFERPDIIIAYDKRNKVAIDVADNLSMHSEGKILTREDVLQTDHHNEDIEILVVSIGGWNNFLRNNDRITGLLKLKVNQLKKLGYKSILIPWSDWRAQETSIDRHSYVRRKLSEFI